MAQNYLWKVECGHYHYSRGYNRFDWWYESKVFTNKMSALKYMNKLQNSGDYRNVRMKKWFG